MSVLTSAIQPTLDGDYVAYEAGSALVLQLVVQADRPGQVLAGPDQGLVLKPGGTLELPLTEYEDRVRSQAAFAAGVRLTHAGPAERLMNPGATAIFNLTAASANEVDDPYLVEVLGANQEWAKLLTPQTIRLGAGDEKTLGVAVVAPGAAADGERADLIVQVTSANDPNLRALARLLATVDVDAEHPDDALHAVELDPKNVPVVPIAVVLVGLAAAAGQRRTRMRP